MNDNQDYRLGMEAAKAGLPAAFCPFAFARVGVSQERFEHSYHPRLDQWMAGWNAQHKAAGTMPYQQKPRAAHPGEKEEGGAA